MRHGTAALVLPDFPGLGQQLNAIGSGAVAAIAEASDSDASTVQKQQLMREALVTYAGLLTTHYDHSITEQELAEDGLPSEQQCMSFGSLEEIRKAFNEITEYLVDRFKLPEEREIAVRYRGVALNAVGLHFSELVTPVVASADVPTPTRSQGRFLDSEFVAIYW